MSLLTTREIDVLCVVMSNPGFYCFEIAKQANKSSELTFETLNDLCLKNLVRGECTEELGCKWYFNNKSQAL